jgi:hypothetical protein
MNNLRTIWITSMLVTTMIVQAMAFVGVAGASNVRVGVSINFGHGLSFLADYNDMFLPQNHPSKATASLMDQNGNVLETKNLQLRRLTQFVHGAFSVSLEPNSYYKVMLTIINNDGTKFTGESKVTTPPLESVTGLTQIGTTINHAKGPLQGIHIKWDNEPLNSQGHVICIYYTQKLCGFGYFNHYGLPRNEALIDKVNIDGKIYSLSHPITKEKTYTITVASIRSLLWMSQFDQIARGEITHPSVARITLKYS